jgi:hypothetical protein
VRGVVPDELKCAWVFAAQKLDLGVAFDLITEIDDSPVQRHRDRAFGK